MQFDNLWEEKNKRIGIFSGTAGFIGIVLIAFILAFFLSNFVFSHVIVMGPSMEDTLQNGDDLWVLRTKNVKTDDIIVFDWEVNGKPDRLIKRVVAVGGETVVLDGKLIKVVSGDSVRIAHSGFSGSWDVSFTYTVPEGSLFIMGDNINISYDSTEFGAIPLSVVTGRVL